MPRTKPNGASPVAPPSPGDLVRRRRRELGLSQVELAAAVGVHQSAISRMERGEADALSRGNLLIVAMRLDLSPTSLDPSLEGVYTRVDNLERGRVTLHRLSDGIHWTAVGSGIEGTKVIRDRDLGRVIRDLAERGIAVEVPALPPVE
jgi:transcriptional regulator with XRE-family HTH domain